MMAHKGTAAFVLTVSLLKGAVLLKRIISMVVLFSLMSPIGILLGIGLMMILSGRAEQVFEAGFDALAAGSFLFIAISAKRLALTPQQRDDTMGSASSPAAK